VTSGERSGHDGAERLGVPFVSMAPEMPHTPVFYKEIDSLRASLWNTLKVATLGAKSLPRSCAMWSPVDPRGRETEPCS